MTRVCFRASNLAAASEFAGEKTRTFRDEARGAIVFSCTTTGRRSSGNATPVPP